MTPTEPRVPVALEAALNQVRTTAAAAAVRAADALGVQAQNSGTKISDREQLLTAQIELRRNMGTFGNMFLETFRERVAEQLAPKVETKRKLDAANWQTLSLVDNNEMEERMNFVRIGQMISNGCEWQLRDLAAFMGTVLGTGRAEEDRNPLRPELIGAALYRGIETVSTNGDTRKLLAREIGLAMATTMAQCYTDILRVFQEKGFTPVNLTVRTVEGPGQTANSGYMGMKPGPSGYDELEDGNTGSSAFDLLSAHQRALAGATPGGGVHGSRDAETVRGALGPPRGAGGPRGGSRASGVAADAQLMTLLRRLTAATSRVEVADPGEHAMTRRALLSAAGASSTRQSSAIAGLRGGHDAAAAGRRSRAIAGNSTPSLHDSGAPSSGGGSGPEYSEQLTGLMAVNLIRAHREELMQATTGKLDHMVIDVVGSLFDQILSDSRVPPQMARQIARLQLPVLRVALNDSTFFSTRRHPVRRFVNRIASLACAYDNFEEGPGAEFLNHVKKLVDEIVEGDFDQVDIYSAKLAELEQSIGAAVEQTGAVAKLDEKESELRIQQRYMLQLRAALAPLSLPEYLQNFLSQVWSQALVLAVRRDGQDSDRAKRYRRVGVDIAMSVQPKGTPLFRKKFLIQLPPLMKDLNEGMQLIGWPDNAQKEFFGKLLPAHAESLKGGALTELDHNMMVKQLEAVFALAVPAGEAFSRTDAVPDVPAEVIEQRFTAEEAAQVGLVAEAAVDWSEPVPRAAPGQNVDIDLSSPQPPEPATPSVVAGLDPESVRQLAPTNSESGDHGEPTRGPQLIDHIKLGFAYQMHLKDVWQKVRLAHVSSGRSFFVFTRGEKHQETISMTSRMLARMCESGRLRAVESAYLMERATQRARQQLAELTTRH